MSSISGQAALKVLEKKGFRIRKGKGSHVVVDRPCNHTAPFVVPIHEELKKGTLNYIIKCSKDFKDNFYRLLK